MNAVLVNRCLEMNVEELELLYDNDREVTFDTFFRAVSLKYVADLLGYSYGEEKGLHLKKDSIGLQYFRSVYRGKPCWHLVWSKIDHIFQERT